jgi:hypothetical protein
MDTAAGAAVPTSAALTRVRKPRAGREHQSQKNRYRSFHMSLLTAENPMKEV